MDISVVIVTRNCEVFIKRCIESLSFSSSRLGLEIIVVDNASTDKTIGLLRTGFPSVKIIQNAKNLGFTKANNQGIKEAKGRYVFILNPDTELLGGSLEEMIKFLDRNTRCGILGPKLLDRDGKIQLSCRVFPSYSTAFFNRYSFLTKMFPHSKYADRYLKTNWPHDTIQEVDWVSGAAMVIKRECLLDVGGFDEGFFIYCEDTDICKRAKDKGWKVLYYPQLYFSHFVGGTLKHTSLSAIFWHNQSMWHYYKKHFKANILWDALVFTVIVMRAILLSCIGLIRNLSVLNKNKK